MKMRDFARKYSIYAAAVVLFVIAAFAYCRPVLSGKVLQSSDDINALSAIQESRTHDKADGDYGFWNGSMFSGMPNYQIGGGHYKSTDLITPFTGFLQRGPQHPAWILIFYFLSFFILLRAFGLDGWLSIAGAFAIALSSYFLVIIAAGHGGKTISISYITLVAAGFYLIFRKKYGLGAIFTMFFTCAGFSVHPQMSYYIFMMIGLFYLAELYIHIREKRYKDLALATLIFALSLGIGIGTRSSNVLANREYAQQTMRGGHSDLKDSSNPESGSASKGLDLEYATQWSYGIDESLSFIIPGVMGGSSHYPVGKDSKLYKTLVSAGVPSRSAADFCEAVPMYWGDQPFTAGNVYMGAIVCFLFILGLLIVKGPYKWALLAATLFSVMLAWGHNFMWLTELFFNYFPLYNKFRAVSSILIVAEIAMPLLGFLAIKEIAEKTLDAKQIKRSILTAGGISAGLCLAVAIFGPVFFSFISQYDQNFIRQIPDWLYQAIVEQRQALLRSDSMRSFLFIVLAAATLYAFAAGKLKKNYLAAILTVLIIADMWPVDRRYFNDSNFMSPSRSKAAFQMQEYEKQILADPEPHFRVMNLSTSTFNDARTSYYLKSIGGYSAAKLRRYQDLIDEHLSQMELPVIGMLNAKYLIIPAEDGTVSPQLNPYALGNAWFVDSLTVVQDARQESDALREIDLRTTAVLDKSFAGFVKEENLGHDPEAAISLTKYTPRFIDYHFTASKPGTVVFSEIYYPHGWKASIDGQRVEHFRVNYLLRALNVPAGEHDIHFEFDPDSVRTGDLIATICIIIMYAAALAIIITALLRRKKTC